MANPTDIKHAAAGMAALSICESLLLALNDLEIMSAKDTAGVLEDAAALHRGVEAGSPARELHLEAAAMIARILTNGKPMTKL